MTEQHPFKWRHFQSDIILLCVRWYLRYSLSYRDLEEIMLERGLHVDHSTIYRWVQHYAPELDKRCRPHLKACNNSWKVDETYIKIKKVWMYLYRAVDSKGNTLEFLLSPTRDAEAAKRFFLKALHSTSDSAPQGHTMKEQVAQPMTAVNPATPAPRVINVDKNAAYPVTLPIVLPPWQDYAFNKAWQNYAFKSFFSIGGRDLSAPIQVHVACRARQPGLRAPGKT